MDSSLERIPPRHLGGIQEQGFFESEGNFEELSTRNMLVVYADHRFIQNIPIDDSRCARVSRMAAKCGLVILAIVGTLPYANVSLDFTGRNVLGYFMVYGNTVSFSSLNAWSLLNIVNTELMPSSPEEVILFNEEKQCCRRTVSATNKAVAVVLGVMSQIPLAYVAYVYNGNHWVFPILVLGSDSGYSIYSLSLTFKSLFSKIGLNPFERKLQLVKEFLVQRLQGNVKSIISLPENERRAFLDRLKEIKNLEEFPPRARASALFAFLFSQLIDERVETVSCVRKIGIWTSGTIGVALTLARLAIIAITAYKAIELFTDDPIACGFSAVLITACNAWLTYDVIVNSSIRTYDTVINICNRSLPVSFSSVYYPKLSVSAKLFLLGTASLSWAPSYEVPHDNTTGDFQKFMEVAVPLGAIILVGNAMNDFADAIIKLYASHLGTPSEKEYHEFEGKINRFSLLITRSPSDSFAKFITLLPQDVMQECFDKGDFSSEELVNYLGSLETESTPLFGDHTPISFIDQDGEEP